MLCRITVSVEKEDLKKAGAKLRSNLNHDNVTSNQIIQVALSEYIKIKSK